MSQNLAETIRKKDSVKECVEILLKGECKNYDFDLEDKFCDGDNLQSKDSNLVGDFPKEWNKFFATLFNSYSESDNVKRKDDMILFQICHYIIFNESFVLIQLFEL